MAEGVLVKGDGSALVTTEGQAGPRKLSVFSPMGQLFHWEWQRLGQQADRALERRRKIWMLIKDK